MRESRSFRRWLTPVVLLFVMSSTPSAQGKSSFAPTVTCGATPPNPLRSDFNNDEYADAAIGIYSENIGSTADAGGANVVYGSVDGLQTVDPVDQFWQQGADDVNDTPEQGDLFGKTVGAGDFNGDGYADLAVGAYGENDNAGVVHILYGGSGGLFAPSGSNEEFFHQGRFSPPGDGNEDFDDFGIALAAGDFNGDGYDDLAIGADGEDVDPGTEVANAGAIYVLNGSTNGLTTTAQFWYQGKDGEVAGNLAVDDYFGRALAARDFNDDGYADLAIGTEEDDVGLVANAGSVNVLYGSAGGLTATGDVLFTQDTNGMAGDGAESHDLFGRELAVGDFNGNGYDDLAIGAKSENVGTAPGAGATNVVFGSSSGLGTSGSLFIHQNVTGISDAVEQDDWLGRGLAAGDFDGDGDDDLAIGVYREEGSSLTDPGALHVLEGDGTSPLTVEDAFWAESALGGTAETNDNLARGLGSADYNGDGCEDLIIGIFNQDVGGATNAGGAYVLLGSDSGLVVSTSYLWAQDQLIDDGAEPYDGFGWEFG